MLITVALPSTANAQEGAEQVELKPDSLMPSVSDTIINDSLHVFEDTNSVTTKFDTTISKDAIESKVEYIARDSMRFDMSVEKIYLYGEAQVNYENIQLNADYIEVDLTKNTVTANGVEDSTGKMIGLPVFKEGAQEYEAGKMVYNFDTGKGKISEVKTQEGEGYIKGNEVKKTGTEVLYIRNGYYTTCNLDDPHFSLATSKLKVIPGDKIVTGPTLMKIDDVPTPLALPFGFFPNSSGQSSGILIPTYGDSRQLGFFLRDGGFYWGINEYLDASITGDIYSLGSWATNVETRYRRRYRYNGNLNFSYSNILSTYREFPDFTESNEFFVRWNHSQDTKARPGTRFSANVNVGSRTNFQNNLNSFTSDYLTNTFQSGINYSNSFPSKPFNLSVSARHNQNTQTGAFNVTLPEVAFNVSRLYPFKSVGKIGNEWWRSTYQNLGISYSGSATNQLSTNDTLLSINNFDNLVKDFRNGVQHNIPISTSFKLLKHANISPSFNYSEVWAFKTIRRGFDPTTRTLEQDTLIGLERGGTYNFNTALTTKFYSMYNYRSKKLIALRHVMTPSISFNYRPEINTGERTYTDTTGTEITYSIFEGGVYGSPNQRKSGRVGFGLLNNIEIKVKSEKDSTGVKKITLLENLGFNSGYELTADSLNWSPLSFNGRTRIGQFLSLNFNGALDPYGLDSAGRKINTTWQEQEGKLFRLTSASIALNFSLRGGNKANREKKKSSKFATEEELEYINNNLDRYVDFTVPWSLNIGYNIRYGKPAFEESITQTFNFSGDLSVTENWKVGFTSGWDFEQQEFTYTSLNINRDLHCWQMAIIWIPYGPRQSYNLTINVKASVLQDLKLNRRRDFYDVIQ